jgi:bla regulator protein blaR1
MSVDVVGTLSAACLALSASCLCAMAARRSVRRLFGASVAYAVWAVVPLATLTSLLPPVPGQHWTPAIAVDVHEAVVAVQAAGRPAASSTPVVAALWGIGALAMLIAFVAQHRRFVRSLGDLDIRHGIAIPKNAPAHGTGPLLLGLWRPVVVVPVDFRQRYTARERRLILAHERIHERRRDPLANVICAALQCVFWFNPLAHWAARLFRFDQELACDDLVLRRHPGMPRSYADAILKTLSTPGSTPLGCQWPSTHPQKERLVQLQRPAIASKRRAFGQALVAISAAAMAYSTWAAQSEAPAGSVKLSKVATTTYDIAMTISVDGQTLTPRVRTAAGVPATIQFGTEPAVWTVVLNVTAKGEGQVLARSDIRNGPQDVGAPALLLALGQPGAVHIDADAKHPALDLKLAITEARGG